MCEAMRMTDLQNIPGVGPSIEQDFLCLGINRVADLRGADPQALYDRLTALEGRHVDRCVLYVFRCAVYFASETQHEPEKLKWWNWKDKQTTQLLLSQDFIKIPKTKGLVKFKNQIAEAIISKLTPIIKENELEIDFWKMIFDFNDSTSTINRTATIQERFIGELFHGCTEIINSLETLEEIALYVKTKPHKESKIPPERLLRFQIETWYGEIYILKSRLENYLKTIKRLYKKSTQAENIDTTCEIVKRLLNAILGDIINIRNEHIHKCRFQDSALDRLDIISALTESWEDNTTKKLWHRYLRKEYAAEKNKWHKAIKKANKGLTSLLDHYFDLLYIIVYNEETEKINYPDTQLYKTSLQ